LDADRRLPGTIFVSNAEGEFRSTDSGSAFTLIAGLPRHARQIAFGAADPRTLYAGEAARRSGNEAGRAALAVDPVVPGRVYLGNSGVLQIDTFRR